MTFGQNYRINSGFTKALPPGGPGRLPQRLSIFCRNCTEIFCFCFRKYLKIRCLTIEIARLKYFKKIGEVNGNSIFFTIFAVPKIGIL